MKMNADEFRDRLRAGTAGSEPVTIVDHGMVIGHFLPTTQQVLTDDAIEAWRDARHAARERWMARTPHWKDMLLRHGLDDGGDSSENDPRS